MALYNIDASKNNDAAAAAAAAVLLLLQQPHPSTAVCKLLTWGKGRETTWTATAEAQQPASGQKANARAES